MGHSWPFSGAHSWDFLTSAVVIYDLLAAWCQQLSPEHICCWLQYRAVFTTLPPGEATSNFHDAVNQKWRSGLSRFVKQRRKTFRRCFIVLLVPRESHTYISIVLLRAFESLTIYGEHMQARPLSKTAASTYHSRRTSAVPWQRLGRAQQQTEPRAKSIRSY